MNIVIDLTSLSYHITGIERYAMCITEKILDIDKENTYILIFRNEIHSNFIKRIDDNKIKAVVLKGNNKLWFLQVVLLRKLRQINADKYLFFAFPSPFFFCKKGIINTIHDMGAWDSPECMTIFSKYYFKFSYYFVSRFSDKIITVSYFSKQRIMKKLNVPEEKVVVANSAVCDYIRNGSIFPYDRVKKMYNLPDRYIMTLSTIEPRKNIKILLKAYENVARFVDYDLVLVGRNGWKMQQVLDGYKSKDRIHFTGYVKDEYLSSLYKYSICFVFPSLYEGFGLPPLEALSVGTPVISSNSASLPEVLMERAVYFDGDSINELENLLIDLDKKIQLMPRGLNAYQNENYNFSKSAQIILELL